MACAAQPPTIRRLDQATVNRIAAGEVCALVLRCCLPIVFRAVHTGGVPQAQSKPKCARQQRQDRRRWGCVECGCAFSTFLCVMRVPA